MKYYFTVSNEMSGREPVKRENSWKRKIETEDRKDKKKGKRSFRRLRNLDIARDLNAKRTKKNEAEMQLKN